MLTAATDHLARLVAFDTTSRNSNTDLIDHVAEYLARHGIASFRVESDDGRKASLFATIGPAVPGGIVLSGHTDVVPVEDQAWSSDPFTLVAREGRLFGRGTCDMKGFIACVLAVVPEFSRLPLAVPLHLAFSYDEEVGCLAAPALIEALLAAVPKPAFAVIGEPTEMRVVQAHRGIASFETIITGRAGHSSKPEAGVNAIFAAAACIGALAGLARDDGQGQAPA
ncbi:MAG TPA: M20/M25/M40 family metallo-hydrolase, partial [Rhodospirillales bacterium]|nr:M20/M25/M40 family metallo-hydrolase [Rhodospirillales bacterium]